MMWFFGLVLQELEAIKARVREMEEEAEKLKELQNEVEKQMNLSPPPGVFACTGDTSFSLSVHISCLRHQLVNQKI